MFPEQLKKILDLIKRTGDRVIIFDGSQPDDSYVVMNLDSYTDLVQTEAPATGPQAAPRPAAQSVPVSHPQEKITPAAPVRLAETPSPSAPSANLTEEDLTDRINREISLWKNRENGADLGEENKPKRAWEIPPVVKNKAEEVV